MTNDQDKSCSFSRPRAMQDHTSHAEIALSNRRHHSLHLSISVAPDGPEGRLTLASRRLTQTSHMPSHLPQQAAMPVPGAFTQRSKMHSLSPHEHVRPVEESGDAVLSSKAQAERFSEVVLPHLGDALALARWLTGNMADAEDVVQDACVKAHAGIAGYAGGNPRAWLLTIVRNASYTWLARNRPRGVVAVGDLNDLDDMSASHGVNLPDTDTPEASLIAKADSAALEAAIAALPEPFRETFVLRDINGLSYREISAMVGAPIGTVMSRLARARSKLMSDLGRAQ